MGLIGGGLSAAGTIAGGIAAQNSANYQAAIASNNAIIAKQKAVYSEQAGGVATENQGRKGAAKLAGIKTAQGANGVDVNSGSAVDVQAGQRETSQLDTETVMQNANLHAYGYRNQATNFESEEALDKAKADNAVPASLFAAGGGLLSSASSISGKWGGSSGWSSSSSGASSSPVYAPDDI